MPNRYTRDELIRIALSMAQLPNLDIHDIPDGVVQPDAHSIQWLQDILDFWYHMVPFSATVDSTELPMTANIATVSVPADFILDVRNGYLVQTIANDALSYRRMVRLPFQKFLTRSISSQKATNVTYPYCYTVVGEDAAGLQTIRVAPIPTQLVNGELWYYKLPTALSSNSKPSFPNDYVCTEYIRIRALEWARVYEPGTAHKFCERIIAGMKAAGMMNEPEDDEVPLDNLSFKGGSASNQYATYAWMGSR